MKIAHIYWVDSQTDIGWNGQEFYKDLIENFKTTFTIGLVAFETKDFITICSSYDETTEEYNCAITIPKCSIKRISVFDFVKIP